MRKTYRLGQLRISRYLKRYHDIKVSPGGVYVVLKCQGLNKLPRNKRKRSMEQFKRYEKQVPGHRLRVDVKFLFFTVKDGKEVKRFQCTVIDDATRACALRFYDRHSQKRAIDFIDYVPHLKGKVERSHLTDQQEFYQLIEYTDDIDIEKKAKRMGDVL